MSDRNYPYNAWVLHPSFRLKQVVLIKRYETWGDRDYGDITDGGKLYPLGEQRQSLANKEIIFTIVGHDLPNNSLEITANVRKEVCLFPVETWDKLTPITTVAPKVRTVNKRFGGLPIC